jgi:hypothetical protein
MRDKTNPPFAKRLVLFISVTDRRNIARIHEIDQRDIQDRHPLEKFPMAQKNLEPTRLQFKKWRLIGSSTN